MFPKHTHNNLNITTSRTLFRRIKKPVNLTINCMWPNVIIAFRAISNYGHFGKGNAEDLYNVVKTVLTTLKLCIKISGVRKCAYDNSSSHDEIVVGFI